MFNCPKINFGFEKPSLFLFFARRLTKKLVWGWLLSVVQCSGSNKIIFFEFELRNQQFSQGSLTAQYDKFIMKKEILIIKIYFNDKIDMHSYQIK